MKQSVLDIESLAQVRDIGEYWMHQARGALDHLSSQEDIHPFKMYRLS